jgi:hypothetical protein
MREIRFENKKALPYMLEAIKLGDEINKIILDWQKVVEKVGILRMRMDKLKAKARPMIANDVKKHKLGEFEVVESFNLDGKEFVVKIADMLELYKEQYLKNKTGEQINGEKLN